MPEWMTDLYNYAGRYSTLPFTVLGLQYASGLHEENNKDERKMGFELFHSPKGVFCRKVDYKYECKKMG